MRAGSRSQRASGRRARGTWRRASHSPPGRAAPSRGRSRGRATSSSIHFNIIYRCLSMKGGVRCAASVARTAAAAPTAAERHRAGGAYDPPRSPSDVEAHVEDVAVLDDVRLAFELLLAGPRGLGMTAGRDEIVPAHDLAADEAAGNVRVDRLCSVERGLAAAERPGPRLLLARGEERDQVERLREPAHDLAERRLAAAPELRRLVGGKLRELRLELEIDGSRSVDHLEQRLRRQRLQPEWQVALPPPHGPGRGLVA